MEIIGIEKKTFERMLAKIDTLEKKISSLYKDKGTEKWLTNQDICQILHISKRTLQTYRNNGTLPYSQIERTMFYKPKDIEMLLKRSKL